MRRLRVLPARQAGDTVWVPDAARGFRAAVVQEHML